jgi:hypothetical protein
MRNVPSEPTGKPAEGGMRMILLDLGSVRRLQTAAAERARHADEIRRSADVRLDDL